MPKLPKVAEYVKNVGKSVAFYAVDAIKKEAPGIADVVNDSAEMFRDVAASAKEFRKSNRNIGKVIKSSKIYTAVDFAVKNLIDDAKTGKFYNDRDEEISDQVMGFDDFDFDDDFNFDFDDSGSGGSDSGDMSTAQSTKILSDGLEGAIESSSVAQATAVAESTRIMVGSQQASTRLAMAHMSQMTTHITSSINSLYVQVGITNKFLTGPMQAHLENSKKYYEESIRLSQESNAMLKELLEMNRNLYKAQASSYQPSKLDNTLSYGGINMREYFKNVKSNVKSLLDYTPIGMMSGMMDMGGNGNMLMSFGSNPWSLLLSSFASGMLPGDFKKALKSFDKGLSSMFAQGIAKMNKLARNGDGILSIIGQLFGVQLDEKSTIDSSKYKKSAVPFDGITRQAIIETIPGYLARIEAALTGSGERYYDYRRGSWKSAKQVEKEFGEMRTRAIANSTYSARSDLENAMYQAEAAATTPEERRKVQADAKRKRQAFDKYSRKVFEDRGYARVGGKIDGRDAAEYYGITPEDLKYFASVITKESFRSIAEETMRSRESLSRQIRDEESNGGISRILFNNTFDDGTTGSKQRGPSAFKGGTGLLAQSLDGKGHNIFWYLNEILDAVRSRKMSKKERKQASKTAKVTTTSSTSSNGRESESSSSSSEDGDDGSDSSDDDELGRMFAARKEEEEKKKQESKEEKSKKLGEWVNSKFGDSSFSKFVKTVLEKADTLLSAPMRYLTKAIEKADKNLFSLMFGDDNLRDAEGNKVNSIWEYLTSKIKTTFDDITQHIKKGFNEVFKPFFNQNIKPILDNMKDILKAGWQRAKEGVKNTFGKGMSKIKSKLDNGDVVDSEDIKNAETSASGRVVTKRGLTMISPGEIIVPASFSKKEQEKMLKEEKKEKRRIVNAIGFNAKGTVKNTAELYKWLKQVRDDNTGKKNKNIAAGAIGGVGGLLMGVNPLLGAMAGAGLSILSNSKSFQEKLFGSEDGEKKGIIPKKVVDVFKKNAPDMIDFGIAGGLLGLFTPFGVLGGAAIGAGIGYLKNNETFKKFVFGDAETGKDGLIKPETAEKMKAFIKKSAPAAAVGAAVGLFVGPFGLLGNAALGAGVGLLTNTNKFHDFLFGNDEKEGIVGAFKRAILEPATEKFNEMLENFKDYAKKNILDPLKRFWDPFKQDMKNMVIGIGRSIADHTNDMFEKTVGIPLNDFLQEKIFKPLTNTFFKLIKIPITLGKTVLAAPFKALGAIGDTRRMSQIRGGKASNMTAQERLDFRNAHKGRGFFRETFFGKDKYEEQDKMLAGAELGDLNDMAALAEFATSGEAGAQKIKGQAREALGKEVSKFFNEKDENGNRRYDKAKYKDVEAAVQDILDNGGDTKFAVKRINSIKGLSKEEKSALFDRIKNQLADVSVASSFREDFKGSASDIDKILSDKLGIKVKGRASRRKVHDYLMKEIQSRNGSAASEANEEIEAEEAVTPEVQATTAVNDTMTETKNIVEEGFGAIGEKILSIKEMLEKHFNISPEEEPKEDQGEEGEESAAENAAEPESTAASEGVADVAKVKKDKKFNVDKAIDAIKNQKDELNDAVGRLTADKEEAEPKPNKGGKALSRLSGGIGKVVGGITSGISNMLSKFTGGGDDEDGDSKEAVEARKAKEEEGQQADEDTESLNRIEEYTKRTTESQEREEEELTGSSGKKKKKGLLGGIFGKLLGGLGGMFSFLGVPLKAIAKWGLRAVGIAGGVSLLGYASEWVKTSIWPGLKGFLFGDNGEDNETKNNGLLGKLRGFLFGEKNEDGQTTSKGLIGRIGDTIHRIFYGTGDDNKPGGFIGWIRDHIVEPISGIIKTIKEGGIYKFIGEWLVPKLVGGWSLAMDNIVTPAIALIIKNLPQMLLSLGKAIITGLKIAVTNKGIPRDQAEVVSTKQAATEIKAVSNSNQQDAMKNLGESFKNVANTAKSSANSTYQEAKAVIDYSQIFSANNHTADETYDKEGNKLNKSGEEILHKKAGGIAGMLGAKESTNQVYYDEDGNILLNEYDTWHTSDSFLSKLAKGAGRGFINGLGGVSSPLMKGISKMGTKAAGIGLGSKVVTKVGKTAIKGAANAVNGGNAAGMAIHNAIENTLSNNATSKVLGGMADDAAGAAASAAAGMTDNLLGAGTTALVESADNVVEAGAKAAAGGGKGIVGKATEFIANGAKKLAEGDGIVGKIVSWFTRFVKDNAIMKFLMKACSAGTTKAMLDAAVDKIGKKLGESLVAKAAKSALSGVASAISKFSPLTIVTAVADFAWGMSNADTLLGVAKGDEYKVGLGQQIICGLLNMVNNFITFGLLPTDVLIDIFVEFLFPLFGLDMTSLKEARARADNILDAWNEAHPDEQYTNLEDYNNKDKWTTKLGNGAKKLLGNVWEGTKEFVGNAWEGTKEFVGNTVDKVKTGFNTFKEGAKNVLGNMKDAFNGKVDVTSKDFWKVDENASGIEKVGQYGIKAVTAAVSGIGNASRTIVDKFKGFINDAKQATEDQKNNVKNVIEGKYSVFSKEYWSLDSGDPENPIGGIQKVIGAVERIFQAPGAMTGQIANKIQKKFKEFVDGAKEATADVAEDIKNVQSGKYTVFSKEYWDTNEGDGENPLSGIAKVIGTVERIFMAPGAMTGYLTTKISEKFKQMVAETKEGMDDATEDVNNVKAGKYTIFSKEYWGTNEDKKSEKEDQSNPLKGIAKVVGFVSRIFQAPGAMIGYVATKIKDVFNKMIESAKDTQKDTDEKIKKVEEGDLSVFSKEYWKVKNESDSPLGLIGSVIATVQRLIQAPILIFKSMFHKIKEKFDSIKGWFQKLFGSDSEDDEDDENVGSGRIAKEDLPKGYEYDAELVGGRRTRRHYGRAHAYQDSPRVANIKYGSSTIGKAGCAPVAATNLLNNIRPGSMSVRKAAFYAERLNALSDNKGTDMNYFHSFLRANGVNTRYSENRQDIMNSIRNGSQVIFLGRDGYNNGAPYGTTPHFITATGVDGNGNIIVEDPDLPESRVRYPSGKLFRSMETSIITNSNKRSRRGKGRFGKARMVSFGDTVGDVIDSGAVWKRIMQQDIKDKSLKNTDTGTTENKTSTAGLLGELSRLGANMLRKLYGDSYDLLFGKEEGEEGEDTATESGSYNDAVAAGVSIKASHDTIWNHLKSAGFTDAGAAAIMGNLYAESGLIPNNLENSKQGSNGPYPGWSDSKYTDAVNSGQIDQERFSTDKSGYGLAQWTASNRKRALWDATVGSGISVGDVNGQLDYLVSEFSNNYANLNSALRNSSNSYGYLSDRVVSEFERPAGLDKAKKERRRGFALAFYNHYKESNSNKKSGGTSNGSYVGGEFFGDSGGGGGGGVVTNAYFDQANDTLYNKKNGFGRAANALNDYRSYSDGSTISIPVATSTPNVSYNEGISYASFLQSIVSILMTIAGNTAALGKILELLSSKFDINLDKSEIEVAASQGREQARKSLNDLISRSSGNNTNISKLLNNQDTQYIFNAMAALASE